MSKTAKQPAAKTTIRIGKGKTTTKPSRVLEVARQRKEIDAARAAAKPTRKAAAKATRDRGDASPKKPPRDPQPPTREGERIVLQKPFSLEVSQDITDRCQELTREREALAALKAQRTGLRKALAANDIDLQETVQEENDEGRGIKGKDKPYSLAASQRITTLEAENKRLSAKIKGLDETIADKAAAIREIPDRIKELALEGAQGQGRLPFNGTKTVPPTSSTSPARSSSASQGSSPSSNGPASAPAKGIPEKHIICPLVHHRSVKIDMLHWTTKANAKVDGAMEYELQAAMRATHELGRFEGPIGGPNKAGSFPNINAAEKAVLAAAIKWLNEERKANNDDKALVTELASAAGKAERLLDAAEKRDREAEEPTTRPAPTTNGTHRRPALAGHTD